MIIPKILHACLLSHLSCVLLFVTPWTVAHQAPLSMGFSRQEYWSGLPCPPPEDPPDPGIKPTSLMVSCIGREVLYHWHHLGSPRYLTPRHKMHLKYHLAWILRSPGYTMWYIFGLCDSFDFQKFHHKLCDLQWTLLLSSQIIPFGSNTQLWQWRQRSKTDSYDSEHSSLGKERLPHAKCGARCSILSRVWTLAFKTAFLLHNSYLSPTDWLCVFSPVSYFPQLPPCENEEVTVPNSRMDDILIRTKRLKQGWTQSERSTQVGSYIALSEQRDVRK